MHRHNDMAILACCDRECVGKTLEEGEISFTVKEPFYKGVLVSEKELKALFEESNSMNLVGKKAVGIALKSKLVDEKDVRLINGVPHVQVYRL